MKNRKLPELLSPAGSLDAFMAAIDGGADAIYLGSSDFNARINAKNFTDEELGDAIRLAHLYGVKVYQALNTMVYDRELDDLLRVAEKSAKMGIDAFIVSDLGAAMALRARLPGVELHASTQMSIHNSEGAKFLADHGFCRVVPARELTQCDIKSLVENNPLEVEIFVHGALCVSHSGQCLFSSLVGGRSGNRGLCAQPCRLPYSCGNKRAGDKYPLSLKDLSLANHIPEIIESGVASLKIEGRMKSPEYVYGVTSIYRRLLDEGRNATRQEEIELASLFSRGGFTDGYYAKKIGRSMLGTRSKEDKEASREIQKFNKIGRKVGVCARVKLAEGEPLAITYSCGEYSASGLGAVCQRAINAPLDYDSVKKCIAKLGDTPFFLEGIELELDGNVMLPISLINSLRREVISRLADKMCMRAEIAVGEKQKFKPMSRQIDRKCARFLKLEQITRSAREYFDITLLPLNELDRVMGARDKQDIEGLVDGIVMPPVILDSEQSEIEKMLCRVKALSPKYAVVSNLSQINTVRNILGDIRLIADFRFNIANNASVLFFEDLGFDSVILSAELTLPQIRDIEGSRGAIVYGRIPLMTLEKCAIRDMYDKDEGCKACASGKAQMTDRMGVSFPIIRQEPHRNIVLNSLPTNMSDRQDELIKYKVRDRHFIFTIEEPCEVDRVVNDYKNQLPCATKVRRI